MTQVVGKVFCGKISVCYEGCMGRMKGRHGGSCEYGKQEVGECVLCASKG